MAACIQGIGAAPGKPVPGKAVPDLSLVAARYKGTHTHTWLFWDGM